MSQKNLVDKIAKAILFRRSIARLISGLIDYDKDYFYNKKPKRYRGHAYSILLSEESRPVVDMGKLRRNPDDYKKYVKVKKLPRLTVSGDLDLSSDIKNAVKKLVA